MGYVTQSDGADLNRGAILHQLVVLQLLPTPGVAAGGAAAAVETGGSWCVAGGGDIAQVEQAGDGDAWWVGGVICDGVVVQGPAEAGEMTFGFDDEA